MQQRLVLALLLTTASISGAAGEPGPQEQLEAVNSAIGEIEQWLDEAAGSLNEEERALRRIQHNIQQREQDIAGNRQRIQELEDNLADLRNEAEILAGTIESDRELVARAVRASWMSRGDSPLKLLLNQQDPERGNRMLHYYDAFNRARIARIESWQEDLASLQRTRARITTQQQALDEENRKLRERLSALDTDRDQRRALIGELQTGMEERSATLESLQADREQLEALVEEIERIVVDIPAPGEATPFEAAAGDMPWPLPGRPVNRFGESYSDGNMRRQGIIIEADAGTPVRAIHQGRVVFADWLRGSGLLVVVDHGAGYISLYAHNGALDKRSGDRVDRGEPLASAGTDAGMNTPGVYFEIRHNGTPQDPVDWLQEP